MTEKSMALIPELGVVFGQPFCSVKSRDQHWKNGQLVCGSAWWAGKLKKHENILYLDTDNWATKSQVICDGGGDNCNQQFKKWPASPKIIQNSYFSAAGKNILRCHEQSFEI